LPVQAPDPPVARTPAAGPLFVYCGRLSEEKGLDLLVRVFARLRVTVPAARLRLVGTGPRRPHLERLVSELGLEETVELRGWVRPEDVGRELTDAWALVAPSLHAEPLGLVAVEALVSGVPVVASSHGGFSETVRDGVTGLLFPNGDETALFARLEAVAQRTVFPTHEIPDEATREIAEAHDVDRHLERLRAIYRELLAP
jgi:glycosyltransferase involved in cell wall biosynthesis